MLVYLFFNICIVFLSPVDTLKKIILLKEKKLIIKMLLFIKYYNYYKLYNYFYNTVQCHGIIIIIITRQMHKINTAPILKEIVSPYRYSNTHFVFTIIKLNV